MLLYSVLPIDVLSSFMLQNLITLFWEVYGLLFTGKCMKFVKTIMQQLGSLNHVGQDNVFFFSFSCSMFPSGKILLI